MTSTTPLTRGNIMNSGKTNADQPENQTTKKSTCHQHPFHVIPKPTHHNLHPQPQPQSLLFTPPIPCPSPAPHAPDAPDNIPDAVPASGNARARGLHVLGHESSSPLPTQPQRLVVPRHRQHSPSCNAPPTTNPAPSARQPTACARAPAPRCTSLRGRAPRPC